jgi:hypothetical protein
MRRWLRAGFVSALLVSALPLVARSVSRHYVFRAPADASCQVPGDVRARAVVASDGAPVHMLELEGPAGARVVVYFHNNRETVEENVEFARSLRDRGFGVLMVEYRGYGASRALSPSEEGLYCDAEAALGMLAARGVGPDRVVLWGTSLGTGVAAEMARRGRGSELVLVTPYTSIPDLVTAAVPVVPARALMPDQFDTLGKSRAIRVPTLVVHGDCDEVVPFEMGARIARSIPGARLVRVPGGRHGDLLARDRERILRELLALGT